MPLDPDDMVLLDPDKIVLVDVELKYWQTGVIKELKELDEKTGKLEHALMVGNVVKIGIGSLEVILMTEQLHYMSMYAKVLRERIAGFV